MGVVNNRIHHQLAKCLKCGWYYGMDNSHKEAIKHAFETGHKVNLKIESIVEVGRIT